MGNEQKPPLGRLEQINLREYWLREDTEFTPWLAEEGNLALLSESLGMKLVLDSTEVSVGPFVAIGARTRIGDSPVV